MNINCGNSQIDNGSTEWRVIKTFFMLQYFIVIL